MEIIIEAEVTPKTIADGGAIHLKDVLSTPGERPARFVAFVTGGFPEKTSTVPLLLAMQRAGADVIEVGVPFSDPLADGPTIQYSSQVALDQGVTYAGRSSRFAYEGFYD